MLGELVAVALALTSWTPASEACVATASGTSAYPHYCEYREEMGGFRGSAILIHGGAWVITGPGAVHALHPAARRLRRLGFRTYNVDYATGAAGLDSVQRIYDLVAVQTRAPVCLYGESAGGHLALMLAATRRSVACVIGVAAPTDLDRLEPGCPVRNVAEALFSGLPGGLDAWSPAHLGGRLSMPILLVVAHDDPIVPASQARWLRNSADDVRVVRLRPGGQAWVHCGVSRASLRKARAAERKLLTGLSRASGLRAGVRLTWHGGFAR